MNPLKKSPKSLSKFPDLPTYPNKGLNLSQIYRRLVPAGPNPELYSPEAWPVSDGSPVRAAGREVLPLRRHRVIMD